MKVLAASMAAILLSSTAAWAQGAVNQSGTVVPHHAAMWNTKGVIMDAGPASGGNANVGISELPIVGLGKTLCLYDAPVTNALGYHQLCLGANVDGNALISLTSGGGAAPNSLVININGTSYPFPGSGNGNVVGPSTSVIGHVPIFNNTFGNLLADAPATQFQIQGTTATATVSSLYANYNPTILQQSAFTNRLTLSGAISDTVVSFTDGFYSGVTDDDTTASYTKAHTNFGGRIASYGPFSGTWLDSHKNLVGVRATAYGRTASTPLLTGISGIQGEAFQFGSGAVGNLFVARNPSPAGGGIAQAVGLVGVNSLIEASFADEDSAHRVYGVVVTNESTKIASSAYFSSGSGQYRKFIDAGSATVTEAAIIMPGSVTPYKGTIIDYGTYNGNPVGGSYTGWKHDISGGQYFWVNSGVVVGSLDTQGFVSNPASGFNAYSAVPASGTGAAGYSLTGNWINGMNLYASTFITGINLNSATYANAAIFLNTSLTGSKIMYDATNFSRFNPVPGAYELFVNDTAKLSMSPTLTQIKNTEVQIFSSEFKFVSLPPTPTGKQPVCIDTVTKIVYEGAAGAC